MSEVQRTRCSWAKTPLLVDYHDVEWGIPIHNDRALFEFLILEGAQAGLSWETLLRKRDNYRSAFDNFDVTAVAAYDGQKVSELLENPGIIRNKLKVAAAKNNAAAFMRVQSEFGSFDRYLWPWVGDQPQQSHWSKAEQIPAHTAESDALSRDLRVRGFKFVGSTICYAFMQAVGMVNDHLVSCFRYDEVKGLPEVPNEEDLGRYQTRHVGREPLNLEANFDLEAG